MLLHNGTRKLNKKLSSRDKITKFSHSKAVLQLIYFILLSGCANQLTPGGGAVDTVPPKIVDVYPTNGTTNFKEGYIQFDFSKYIDKQTLKNTLFISPAIDGDLDFNWTGTSVKITFPT